MHCRGIPRSPGLSYLHRPAQEVSVGREGGVEVRRLQGGRQRLHLHHDPAGLQRAFPSG